MTIKPWREISRKQLFSKYGRGLDEVIFEMPDGTKSDYIIKSERPAACVVALTQDNFVILVRQFRPGVKEVLTELPGGNIDEQDKNPLTAISREFYEETGFTGNFKKAAVIYDCAYSTRKMHCFVATDCKKTGQGKLDQNEYITVALVSLDEFRKLLKTGKMVNIEGGYLGLDFLGLL
jgi:ADP-ribose pyrophosphatase